MSTKYYLDVMSNFFLPACIKDTIMFIGFLKSDFLLNFLNGLKQPQILMTFLAVAITLVALLLSQNHKRFKQKKNKQR
jgi:hypothetical protein